MSTLNKASIIVILLSTILSSNLKSQSFEKIDSLANEACKTIIQIVDQNKSVSLDTILYQVKTKHIDDYFFKTQIKKVDSILFLFDARLQKTCEAYGRILYEQLENNGNWVRHSTKPIQKIKQGNCKIFYLKRYYSYLETNGDTVKLEIKDGYWIENFKDGSYSKLKIHSNENCEFVIEFEDSNNEIRKSFSKKGDKYRYTIIDENIGVYKLAVKVPEQSIFYTFNLYYEE